MDKKDSFQDLINDALEAEKEDLDYNPPMNEKLDIKEVYDESVKDPDKDKFVSKNKEEDAPKPKLYDPVVFNFQGSSSESKQTDSSAVNKIFNSEIKDVKLSNLFNKATSKAVHQPSESTKKVSLERKSFHVTFLLDIFICILIGYLISVFLSSWMIPEYAEAALRPTSWNVDEMFIYLTMIIPATLIISIFYYFISIHFFGQTIAQRFLGVELEAYFGGDVQLKTLLIRCISTPLSIVLLGFLPTLFGHRSLQDYIAGTKLVRKKI